MSEDKKQIFLTYWRMFAPDGPEPVEEYNFDAEIGRKHRFDFCWPDERVAVEVNGQAWQTKGGGRHGQDADLEKLNLAQVMGYRVFQFSPKMLKENPTRWVSMVADTLEAK
jgi:very-short-patch-repair endonuclease